MVTAKLTENSGEVATVDITINDEFVNEATTEELKLASDVVPKVVEVIRDELIHRTDEDAVFAESNEKKVSKEISKTSSSKEIIQISIKPHSDQQVDKVMYLVSPYFGRIIGGGIPEIITKYTWIKITLILAPFVLNFLLLTFILWDYKNTSAQKLLITFLLAIMSVIIARFFIRLIDASQRFTLEKQIRSRYEKRSE